LAVWCFHDIFMVLRWLKILQVPIPLFASSKYNRQYIFFCYTLWFYVIYPNEIYNTREGLLSVNIVVITVQNMNNTIHRIRRRAQWLSCSSSAVFLAFFLNLNIYRIIYLQLLNNNPDKYIPRRINMFFEDIIFCSLELLN